MDEGITTFATGRAMAEDFPDAFYERRFWLRAVVFKDVRTRRETVWNRLPGYRAAPTGDAPSTRRTSSTRQRDGPSPTDAIARRPSCAAGASLGADTAASGVNDDWMQEFGEQASGASTTMTPAVIGFGAVLDNLSAFVDERPRPLLVLSSVVLYLGGLTFLWLFATSIHG